mmetsp:Transcript_696/g.899  ORF Transcript_696/g.899 Transcript_696/m.899 type:complete len:134 (-) Transcript_696:140-541(-)
MVINAAIMLFFRKRPSWLQQRHHRPEQLNADLSPDAPDSSSFLVAALSTSYYSSELALCAVAPWASAEAHEGGGILLLHTVVTDVGVEGGGMLISPVKSIPSMDEENGSGVGSGLCVCKGFALREGGACQWRR